MKKTKIEWTEESWNPTIGCSKVSSGCENCYAEVMAKRLQSMRTKGYEDGFKFKQLPERLEEPLHKKKPTMFFVDSMSDLFHEKMTIKYLDEIFSIIKQTPQHTYQILTKRPHKMAEYFEKRNVPNNAWLGVTVEDKISGLPRIEYLRKIKAPVKFLSIEPLLENLGKLNLNGINWVIVGGESGPKARPMKKEWVLNIQKQCQKAKIPFFFKKWGVWGADNVKRSKKANGRKLMGKIWDEYPYPKIDLVKK